MCLIGILSLPLFLGISHTSAGELTKSLKPAKAPPPPAATIRIVGNGPERHLMEILSDAYEQRHPTISIDFFWHSLAKPTRTLELREADIAVTGETEPSFRSTVIARDGIAVLTNFSNPVKEIASAQLSEVFSGKLRYWSQVYEEAPQTRIKLVNRSSNQNIRQGFQKWLKLPKGISRTAYRAETEQEAITMVSGNLEAVTFVSMTHALRAKEDGVAINLLFIDNVEPEIQTVLDKRYPIQRPVILLTRQEPSTNVLNFEKFILSDDGQRLIKKSKYYPLSDQ